MSWPLWLWQCDSPLESIYNTAFQHQVSRYCQFIKIEFFRCQTTAEKVIVFMAENSKCSLQLYFTFRHILYLILSGCFWSTDFTSTDLDRLPFGVGLPIREAIHMCSQNPACDLSQAAYSLISK
jgi:hypothetical protein